MMRLTLLLDRRHAPYLKWLGTAFTRGQHDDDLPTHLLSALRARDLAAREASLAQAYETLGRRHNRARLTPPLDASTRPYHGRPARVLMADRFAAALLETVTNPALLALPLIGSVDQVVDATDILNRLISTGHSLRSTRASRTLPAGSAPSRRQSRGRLRLTAFG
jgi:hypothetical protein